MTNFDFNAAVTAIRERDAKLAESARKRSDKFCAFMLRATVQESVIRDGVNLELLFTQCDKTRDRFVRVYDAVMRNDMSLKNESDQNRYTFNLVRSLIQSVSVKSKLNKTDILATATKRDDASEFVTVSRRIMQDSTAERQSGIAQFVLTACGVVTRSRNENNRIEMTVNTKSAIYKRFVKMIASETTA